MINLVFLTEILLFLLIIISSTGVIISKNLLYSCLLIVITLLGIAGLFVIQNAEFLAISQIMIYAGGILIVVLFGVMLTNSLGNSILVSSSPFQWQAVVIGTALFGMISWFILKSSWSDKTVLSQESNINLIGKELFTHYVLPFELITMILTIALIGAAHISQKIK